MVLKLIVALFAVSFLTKLVFRKRRERLGRTVDRFANLFLVAIAVYFVVLAVTYFVS